MHILKAQSFDEFANSFGVKARTISSIVRGTRLEWEKTEKYLRKGKIIGIDLNKDKDPDLRAITLGPAPKTKVTEFKSTSGTTETIKENITKQLTSAIKQLCKRKIDYYENKFDNGKLSAVVEINYDEKVLQSGIDEHRDFSMRKIYDEYANIIDRSWNRGEIKDEIINEMVEANRLGWNRYAPPEIEQIKGKPSQFSDKKWSSMFQINFAFKPFRKVKTEPAVNAARISLTNPNIMINEMDIISKHVFARELKFLVYFITDNNVKSIKLYMKMMMKSTPSLDGYTDYRLYDAKADKCLRTLR